MKITRIEALKALGKLLDADDPQWEWLMDDHYVEETDTMPGMGDLLEALGISKAEWEDATGERCD